MESDKILARAEDALRRHGGTPRLLDRAQKRRRAAGRGKALRILTLAGALAAGVPFWGLAIGPIGMTGFLLALLFFAVAAVLLAIFPRGDEIIAAEGLPTTQLALLPLRTEEWLASQRRALPAPAQQLIDGIGVRLETLAPQLQGLNDKEPAALEIRRLIADELPELVNGYARVPLHLRAAQTNGLTPDRQLVEGLGVVESELARMSNQLASGDLNRLATQGRYLELKYQGDAD